MKKLILSLAVMSGILLKAQEANNEHEVMPAKVGANILEGDWPSDDQSIREALIDLPTVLVVFRGQWCPHCAKHLKEMESVTNQVESLGYQLLAVSPDSPENCEKFTEKLKLSYPILSDANSSFLKALGVVFKAPDGYHKFLKESSGGENTEGLLPVPAVFILDDKGNVVHEHVTPDYKNRLSAKTLVAVLGSL